VEYVNFLNLKNLEQSLKSKKDGVIVLIFTKNNSNVKIELGRNLVATELQSEALTQSDGNKVTITSITRRSTTCPPTS
jgi:hypothetical protein